MSPTQTEIHTSEMIEREVTVRWRRGFPSYWRNWSTAEDVSLIYCQ